MYYTVCLNRFLKVICVEDTALLTSATNESNTAYDA